MIKKIDANKYGVVKYAITSVDELNRLPKKIAPSSQAILIENGLRVFVYGDGQWVEEVVDGDLSENMQSIVADYERSKIGYDGVKRGSLGERLKDDFQGIYDILNARDYCEYRGGELKADNTWMGNQIDTRVEGRTLQNLIPTEWIVNSNVGGHATYNVDTKVISAICDGSYSHARFYGDSFLTLIRAGLTYTICFKTRRVGSSVDRRINLGKYDSDGNIPYIRGIRFTINEGVAQHVYSFRVLDSYKNTDGTQLRFTLDSILDGSLDIYDIVLLEGDHTQTPLSELPYFEGIESVGERDIGKNLLDKSLFRNKKIVSGTEGDAFEFESSESANEYRLTTITPIKVKIGQPYTISLDDGCYEFYCCQVKDGVVKGVYDWKTPERINITFNTETVYVSIRKSDNSPISLSDLDDINIQFTEYEPFGYIIKGKSCGKNLFDIKRVLPTQNGEVEIIKDGFKLTRIFDGIGDTFGASYEIKLKPNTKYILKANTEISKQDAKLIIYSYEDKLWGDVSLGVGEFGKSQTSIMTKNGNCIIGFYFLTSIASWEKGDYAIIKNIQLEESTSSTPYEPYQESTYSIHSPIPLRSLPNGVCDVYDFESGAVIQRVGKVVLDGGEDEHWYFYTYHTLTNTSRYRCNLPSKMSKKINSIGYCDRLPVFKNELWNTDLELIENDQVCISIRSNIINDNKSFNIWLQANPMTIYYELEEPIIHYLTPSQLKSFDGTTHVISENTLIPTTTTKILTDTYANVSNVNSTAYSLRRGVNDVAETSAIINETDVEQDDVLDVTMCAIDELYSMLEPNLE